MANPLLTRTLAGTRVLRNVPVVRLLAAADLLVLAGRHVSKLEPHERRRVLVLLRDARGRPRRNLSARERLELQLLIAKAEPKLFVGHAVKKLTGVPIPGGSRRGQRGR
jgi:hypothetical protein